MQWGMLSDTCPQWRMGEEDLCHVHSGGCFQLHRLPVRPERGQGQTHTRTLEDLDRQDTVNTVRSGMPLHLRPIQWHLEKQL